MVVWQVAAGAGWGERSGLQGYLLAQSQGNSKLAAVAAVEEEVLAAAILKPTPALAPAD